MTTFYKKTDSGEFVEADKDVDELFQKKSFDIVASKISKAREKEAARIREEIEAEVRKTAEEAIKAEARQQVEAELEGKYKEQIAAAESKSGALELKLRRKTIAAEYSFKPELEDFLGDGDDEEMRKKADLLKANMQNAGLTPAGLDKSAEPSNESEGAVRLIN